MTAALLLAHTRVLTPAELYTRAAWPLEWPVIIAVAACSLTYAHGLRKLRRSAGPDRGIRRWQVVSFAAGIATIVLATVTPLAAVGSSLFSLHMLQHLLLVQVAAPLLVIGAPAIAFAWAVPVTWHATVQRMARLPTLRRVWQPVSRLSTHWLFAWGLHAVAIVAWHIPSAFSLALRSDVAHAAQHISFLGTALLLWVSTGVSHWLPSRTPPRERTVLVVGALGVFATGVYGAVLGAMLALTDSLVYRDYARRAIAWGIAPLDDQHLAGLIMWLGGGLVSLGSAVALFALVVRESSPRLPPALRARPMHAHSAPGVRRRVHRRVRRLLLSGLAALCACGDLRTPGSVAGDTPASNAELLVYVVGTDPRSAQTRGALLGGTEAARAATLTGRSISVATVPDVDALAGIAAATVVLIGGSDSTSCESLSVEATRRGWLYLNTACNGDWLLATHIEYPRTLHTAATSAMTRGTGASLAVLWHDALERYGASQLNDRYRARYGAPMNDTAWAAWMGVKVVSEAMLRTPRPATPTLLLSYLLRPDVAFDGHKGEPLRFGNDDHQLRQPVYPAPGRPLASVAPSPATASSPGTLDYAGPRDGTPLVVASNEGSNSLSVIDARSFEPVGVIPLPGRPRGIQTSGDGVHVLVALSDHDPRSEGRGDVIAVVNVRAGVIVARIAGGSDPEQFALLPNGRALLIANEDAGLATIAPRTGGQSLASLAVGIEPEGVAVSHDGRWGYVTAETSNTVSVIDLVARTLAASFLVDVRPRAVTVHPGGRAVYVSNEISGTISIVEPAGDTRATAPPAAQRVTGTIALGDGSKPVGLTVSRDGRMLFVALGGQHAVSVIDLEARRELRRVPVGRRPWNLTISPDGRSLYVANGASGSVSVIDTHSWTVSHTIPVGERPWGVAYVAPHGSPE